MRKERYLRLLATGVGTTLMVLGLASANASSANISHSYKMTTSLPNGSIVSLDSKRSGFVEPANTTNGAQLLGIAVASNDSLLAVDASATKTQVATSGMASALVSTLNGNISLGDPVGVSPFDGVGMKALPGSNIVGLAQATFDARSAGAIERQVKDKSGKSQVFWVGFVPINIDVKLNAAPTAAKLNALQTLVKSLTGRTIPTIRIVIALAVAFIALAILVTLIYASIYGGLVSIGRNPLAKHAVFRVLAYVTAMALLTAGVATVIISFLLK